MEQRKHVRIKKNIAVQIEDSFGMITDISKAGMRLIPDTIPRKLDNIQLYLITESGELIQFKGSITRIEEKEGKYELGLSIPNPPGNYTQYVEALEQNKTPDVMSDKDAPQDLVNAFAGVNEGDQSLGGIIQQGQQSAPAETGQPARQEAPAERIEMSMEGLFQETSQPVGQEAQADETVEMPLTGGGLDQEAPLTGEAGSPLDPVFQAGNQHKHPTGARIPTPGRNEDQYLDEVLKGTPTAGKPAISPEEEASLDGIFKSDAQQPGSPPIPGKDDEEEELSFDNLFNEE